MDNNQPFTKANPFVFIKEYRRIIDVIETKTILVLEKATYSEVRR